MARPPVKTPAPSSHVEHASRARSPLKLTGDPDWYQMMSEARGPIEHFILIEEITSEP